MACVLQIIDAVPPHIIDWNYCRKAMAGPQFYADLLEVHNSVVNNGQIIAEEHLTLTNAFLDTRTPDEVCKVSFAAAAFS